MPLLPLSTKWRSTPPKVLSRFVLREYLAGRSIGEHGALDQHGAVAEFRHAAEIVRRDQHHPAFVAQRAQQLDDRVLGVHVDAGERLVEQDDPAVLRQRAGRKTRFFWPPESSPIWRLRKSLMLTRASAAVDRLMVAAFGDAHACPCGRSGPSSRRPRPAPGNSSRRPRSAAHRRRCSSSAPALTGMPRMRISPLASCTKPMIALNSVDLPRAVDANQRGDRARRDFETRVAQGRVPLR